MFTFCIPSGEVSTDDGEVIGVAYSGHGDGLNNVAMQTVHDVGPIPVGRWTIGPAAFHPHLGPAMALTPDVGTDALGRTAFFIHGDNSQHNHTASAGCVVVEPGLFWTIQQSGDKTLNVVT